MLRRLGALLSATLAWRRACAQPQYTTTWVVEQPSGQSPWMSWQFVQAGSFLIPPEWTAVTVRWAFDGAVVAWHAGQASLGAASCYAPVPPATDHTVMTGACAVPTSRTPYALGVWLWGNAAVMGGTWKVTARYALATVPPAAPPRPPPPAPGSPLEPAPPPAPGGSLMWQPVGGAACTAGAEGLTCQAGVAPGRTPADQLAHVQIPVRARSAYYLGIFLTQTQRFSNLGFPAVVVATDDARQFLLWSTDLPNTVTGESCQGAGAPCPSGGLEPVTLATSAVARLSAAATQLLVGFAPRTVNSWGVAGGAGCDRAGTCAQYGPSVALTVAGTRLLAAAAAADVPAPSPGVDVLLPTGWLGTWSDAAAAFGAGDGMAAALMATGCAAAAVTTSLGWTAGGNASVHGAAAFDGAFAAADAVLSVGDSSTIVGLPGWAAVPPGPLTLTLRLRGDNADCASNGWSRALLTDVFVKLSYPAAPASAFVVKRAWGSCMRGMQPLVVT